MGHAEVTERTRHGTRLRTALSVLDDRAINEVAADHVTRYTVVRIAEECIPAFRSRRLHLSAGAD